MRTQITLAVKMTFELNIDIINLVLAVKYLLGNK